MRQSRAAVFAGVVLFLLCTVPARGTSQRTFVSRSGMDTNPCSIDLPCRSFAAAILQTNVNGEVIVIDSAGYGTVIINQAVSIVAPFGVYAGISGFNTNPDAIFVNAVGGIVALRNLTINSQGGQNGITLYNAAALYIDHCLVSGFSQNNVNLQSGAGTPKVAISDTIVQQAGGAGIFATSVNVSIVRCRLQNNTNGLLADAVSGVAVRDSDADGNSGVGFYLRGMGASGQSMTIQSSVASNNSTGFEVDNGPLAVLGSTASRNILDGFLASGSTAALSLDGCVSSKNFQNGIRAFSGGLLNVADSTISDNVNEGIFVGTGGTVKLVRNTITRNRDGVNNFGTIHSSGDNVVDGNTISEVTGPGTITAANKV